MNGMIEVLDSNTDNYNPPATKPEFDIIMQDEYSLVIFFPNTVIGADWLEEHLPVDCPRTGKGYVVEPRYAPPIIRGIIDDGLNLKMGALI